MIPSHVVEQAKEKSVIDIIGSSVQLRKVSHGEYAGPCPNCGGEDRFHCTSDWWFCRQCHNKRADGIGYHQHYNKMSFTDAVSEITGYVLLPERPRGESATRQPSGKKQWNGLAAKSHLAESHKLLMQDGPCADYLLDRGLEPHTWQEFGLGAAAKWNRDSEREEPAVVLPWYRGATLCGLRYRFIDPHGQQKTSSFSGSTYTNALFGRNQLQAGQEQKRTLIVCEGELNALSIWQVAHDTGVDVLSTGSQGQRLTAAMAGYAQKFMRVLFWMDEPEYTRENMAMVPGAYGISSPGGKDANDLLQDGLLGGYIVMTRFKAAGDRGEKRSILASLLVAASKWQGIDASTAEVGRKLAQELGIDFDVVQVGEIFWSRIYAVTKGVEISI